MANSIIGAIYIGLFTGTVSPGMPVGGPQVQVMPQPQCVLCGPARRDHVARVYDWSTGRIKASRHAQPVSISRLSIDDIVTEQRLDMTSQQVERMANFAGV